MEKEVGVRFPGTKTYSFKAKDLDLALGDEVMVKTSLGLEIGKVIYIQDLDPKKKGLQPVIKKLTLKDKEKLKKLEKLKPKALEVCQRKIQKHGLPMKLIDVHFSLDGERITFLFTSETRVDFRELVKDLVKAFKRQIILRQIGPRDETRLKGGVGRCGRIFCCQSFLNNLGSVSMEMVKSQNLSAKGSSKISGPCGKLLCCLAFEFELYKALKKNLPEPGEIVITKEGEGEVIEQNVLKQTVLVELKKSKAKIEVPISDLRKK